VLSATAGALWAWAAEAMVPMTAAIRTGTRIFFMSDSESWEELVLTEVLILEFYLVIESPQHGNICNVAKNQRNLRAIVRSDINS
jgi:hypothetical protein